MDFSATLTTSERAKVQMQVDAVNATLKGGRVASSELGKDEFLKILITQLSHQDPTAPMEDTEFVAQMAQFSTLEQMTNMSQEFTRLAGILSAGQAINMLGKTVEVIQGDTIVTGVVKEIAGGYFPQLLINGKYYDFQNVQRVME